MKKQILTLAIFFGITLGASAQNGGLFGKGPSRNYDENYYNDRNSGMLSLPTTHGDPNDQSGEAPLGSGALLLIGFGAAYAVKKQRNNRQEKH